MGCGLIAAEEADGIVSKLENPPERPEPPDGDMPDGPPADGEIL